MMNSTIQNNSTTSTPQTPIKVIRRLARLGKWKQFIAYSKQHPSVYQWEGSYGQTLLHCVCTNRPSPNVIQMLLDKNPQSIVKQDKDACLPLHMAMANGASDFCLKLLIQNAPQTVRIPNQWDHTAFQWIWHRQKELIRNVDVKDPVTNFMTWHMIVVLVQAAAAAATTKGCRVERSCERSHGNLLHLATDFDAPLDLLLEIMQTFPLMIKEQDERGCLPLARFSSTYEHRQNDTRQRIDILLSANKEAVIVPDGDGRFPLHLAIASGMTWNGGLQSIFAASPDILLVCDPVTNLPPFMLAALPKSSALDVLYILLSLSPDIIT